MGRIIYAESFVPEFQVYRPLINRDLAGIAVKIKIVYRKLYRVRIFRILKPIFELLPSEYVVSPDKDGLFSFWAYPFDVVTIKIKEHNIRETYTLRHKVRESSPRYVNLFYALAHLVYPKLLHEESIELPTSLGRTCGYAEKTGAFPGEVLKLMVSTSAEKFSLEFLHVGKELRKLESVDNVKGIYQSIKTKYPSVMGCGWKPATTFTIPKNIRSGCYLIKLNGSNKDDSSFIPLIIKPAISNNQIAVIASTNTWHAYNSWGGHNFYINYTSFPSKYILSTQRPLDIYARNPVGKECQITRDHLLVGERFVWSWLEREGFEYDLFEDTDLHYSDVYNQYLKHYKIIIISTHNEYWSYEMINNLREFIKKGGKVLSLSGNTMYKEVTFPNPYQIILDGAYFRYQEFGEETVLGVAHDLRGFKTWAPYKVNQADHWVFEGTNLKKGDVIGQEGLNVSPEGISGASGWETDKLYPDSPRNTVLLAKGANAGDGGADMVIYEDPGGGSVFSVGSITFGGSLLVDDRISRITKNVMNGFLR